MSLTSEPDWRLQNASHERPMVAKTKMLLGSGNYFDFMSPETSLVTIEDIAYGLAGTSRFRGQTVSQISNQRCLYTVAEHCLRGSYQIDPDLAYDFLMHELDEVAWGDTISPQKAFLPDFARVAKRTGIALGRRYGVGMLTDPARAAEVKRIDLIMLATERRDLMPPTPEVWPIIAGVEPLEERIVPIAPDVVAGLFLARYDQIRPARVGQ